MAAAVITHVEQVAGQYHLLVPLMRIPGRRKAPRDSFLPLALKSDNTAWCLIPAKAGTQCRCTSFTRNKVSDRVILSPGGFLPGRRTCSSASPDSKKQVRRRFAPHLDPRRPYVGVSDVLFGRPGPIAMPTASLSPNRRLHVDWGRGSGCGGGGLPTTTGVASVVRSPAR